jgi:hypothetical protein
LKQARRRAHLWWLGGNGDAPSFDEGPAQRDEERYSYEHRQGCHPEHASAPCPALAAPLETHPHADLALGRPMRAHVVASDDETIHEVSHR